MRIGEKDFGNRDGQDLWALKDVSYSVKQGEVLGIIGRNGAGKSTLLKILSRVTAPTSGRVRVTGRITSFMNNSTINILVISERTPQYIGGSGDQKILYTAYCQKPNIHFCIINERKNITPPLDNWTYYFDIHDQISVPEKKWRYAEFLEYFSMKQGRFLHSEIYLSRIVSEIQEIIAEKNIQILVFEQTGILMWSWHRLFSDKAKCILRIHDSHYHYLLSDIRTRKNIFSKIALIGAAVVQKRFEKAHIRQWDQIQFLSQKEHQYYGMHHSAIAEKFVYTFPSIIVKGNEYLLNPDKKIDILFVGTMSWKPNTDAAKWFLSQVLPLIKRELPNIKVKIIGKKATQKINSRDENVDVVGFVQSLDDEYKSAKLFINPSQSGGGIKVKLMDASAFGLPVISTRDGVSGFRDNIHDCLIVKDNPTNFAKAIVQLLRSDDLRKKYSQKIFAYAQDQFNVQKNQELWKSEVSKLL